METKLNWTGKIAQAFATNRSLALLSIVVAVAIGVLGYSATPKQYNPKITRPAFIVGVQYPGATTQEGYDLVGTELVEKVSSLAGVDEVNLQVRDGAHIAAVVIFDVGFDKDSARVALQTQLAQHSYLARGGIMQPTIRELNPDEVPILTVRLTADNRSLAELRAYAVTLSHALADVEDIADIEVHGGYPPALVVELSPSDISRAGVSVGTVLQVVRSASGEFPLVSVRDGTRQTLLDIQNAGVSVDMLAEVALTPTVRLGDVARIYRGTAEVSSYTRYMEQATSSRDAVFLSFAKREDASAPTVSQAVRAELDRVLADPAYTGVSYEVVNDDGMMAQGEISGLMVNLAQSISIVAIVLMVFLSLRSAFVVALSIPFTMLLVFGMGYFAGQTVNRITLFALILSLGLLVDAAIVVVEAVHGILTRSLTPEERTASVVRAVHGVGIGLFLSMLTSVVVFLPMLYITGMMGPYMEPIAFFVPAALFVSFIVAITVLPYLALVFVQPGEQVSRATQVSTRGMEWIAVRYTAFLLWMFARRRHQQYVLSGVVVLFIVSLSIPILQLVHFQMLPKANRDQYFIHIDLPAGSDVLATRAVADAVGTLALADPLAQSVQLFVAEPQVLDFNGMFKGAHLRTAPNQATLRVNLVPKSERDDSSTDIVERARAAFTASALFSSVESVRFVEDPPGPPVMATFVAKVSGADVTARDEATTALRNTLASVPGVVDVDTSIESAYPRIELTVDQTAARAYGVAVEDIYMALTLAGGSLEAGQYHDSNIHEYARVEVRTPRAVRRAPSDLATIMVRSRTGALVPLESLVTTTYTRDRETIMTEKATPLRYVTAETEGRPIVYVMLEVIRMIREGHFAGYDVARWNLFGVILTDGAHEVHVDWGGEWEMTLKNFRDLGLAMLVALL
ncbi:MAG: efflux RND transporter permease subunit, partial [Candidatus Pacebacteria bacterium]|nr:efflux RND transporter permease subunit [Candidatus Paceibacterota bacterium]